MRDDQNLLFVVQKLTWGNRAWVKYINYSPSTNKA